MLPEDVTSLNQNLRAMQMTLEKYDGSTPFLDRHKEFDMFCQATKREQDVDKLHLLVFNLHGQAKETYRAIADEDQKDFAKVCQALRDIFDERQSQRHQRKLAFYKRHQEPHESLRDFVLAAQRAARGLGLSQQDIVDTIVENARPQACIALKGHHFKSVNDLLKSGLISENFGEPAEESTLKILMEEVRALRLERQQQATPMPPTVKQGTTTVTKGTSRETISAKADHVETSGPPTTTPNHNNKEPPQISGRIGPVLEIATMNSRNSNTLAVSVGLMNVREEVNALLMESFVCNVASQATSPRFAERGIPSAVRTTRPRVLVI